MSQLLSPDSMDRETIEEFFRQIGIPVRDACLFNEALSHKSYDSDTYYQRMEFLGDSILSFLSSEYLYQKYSKESEGELSQHKAGIVSREALVNVFDSLYMEELIQINRKSFPDEIPESIKADIIESTLAAVYLDSGMDNARKFFHIILENSGKMPEYFFAKNELQEIVLKEYKCLPEFRVEREADTFACSIFINNDFIAGAEAYNKKDCEKKAAGKAIKILERRLNEDHSLH